LQTFLREIVSSLSYYLLWLAGGLLAIAFISAGVARYLRLRLMRRLKAIQVLDALARYSDWVAAQGHTPYFQGDAREEDSPLQEVRTIRQQWFPELSNETAEIFAVHARLIDFLWTQQMLRVRDPEAWLESDYDSQFMGLWRLHARAVHAAVEKLRLVAGMADGGAGGIRTHGTA
jgi:hypothetical protein